MPPGAKKRKALKKKQQQQEAIGTSRNNNNGDNLHGGGNEEHGGSQDDRESDSNLSSPGSPGNGQFGGIQDPSVAIAFERGMDDKEIIVEKSGNVIAGERGTDEKKFIVEKSPVSSYESMSQTDKNEASQDHCVKEIAAPVVDFDVSKVVIHEKSEHAETSTHSELAIDKSGEDKECPTTGLGEKENGKVATLMESAAGTSRKVESARESEVSPPSEEKSLLLPGPPAVRTSWLSCCGLFDAITGSDR